MSIVTRCVFILQYRPLAVDDRPGKEDKRARTFKIISKQKSFFMRAPTVEAKDEWMQAIQEAVRYCTCV